MFDGEFDIEGAIWDVEGNDVAIGDGGDGSAMSGFGCHVTGHQTVRCAAETAVGQKSDGVAEPCSHKSSGNRQHFAHAGAAFGSFVTNHDDVASLNFVLVNFGEGSLFAIEYARRASESRDVVPGYFYD